MLVDSGADSVVLSLDIALRLGMKPWQLGSGHTGLIDGAHVPVCRAPSGLFAGFHGFPARPIPALVFEHRPRFPKPFDILGRHAIFGSFTILFEQSRAGPRVVLIEPGDDPFRLPLEGPQCVAPCWGDGWASFPYGKEPRGPRGPIVPVRLWGRNDRSVEVPMIVDTGAFNTVVPTAVARELGLPMWRMPARRVEHQDGTGAAVHTPAGGLAVTLSATISGLQSIPLPVSVFEGAGPLERTGKLGHVGLLDHYRLVFHRQDGTDRVTFMNPQRWPPA